MDIWLPSYIRASFFSKNKIEFEKPIHIFFTIVDHFEPFWGGVSKDIAKSRVEKWCKRYPKILLKYRDSEGRNPRHTFFYPIEEYDEEILDMLARLCSQGYGDVEIHLHHDNDTEEGLREKLLEFKRLLYERHRLLRKDIKTGEIVYGFIHGNWALDNSRKDGKWCGVNSELSILKETGCYADFTMPSAPSDTQTSKINSIYYAKDDVKNPKSHNRGIDVTGGKKPDGDLMIIQGPLSLNWGNRKWGIFPKIENGEISYNNQPTPERIDLWIRQHIHVKGKPDSIFIKVHTHGAHDKNMDFLLNDGLDMLYRNIEEKYNDGSNYILHFVTAWEMYNVIKKVEAGG